MWPDRVSNPGPLTYESGALLTALHVPALHRRQVFFAKITFIITILPQAVYCLVLAII